MHTWFVLIGTILEAVTLMLVPSVGTRCLERAMYRIRKLEAAAAEKKTKTLSSSASCSVQSELCRRRYRRTTIASTLL